jgi:hypothetical protein
VHTSNLEKEKKEKRKRKTDRKRERKDMQDVIKVQDTIKRKNDW